MKTAELAGAALDWAVAKCEGYAFNGKAFTRNNPLDDGALEHIWLASYLPSTNWAQGGPIIERESICIDQLGDNSKWCATTRKDKNAPWLYAKSPLIAAMRCYVSSQLGDEVDIPKELTE